MADEDLFDPPADDDLSENGATPDNKAIREMRKQIRDLSKTVKETTPELEELRKFKSEAAAATALASTRTAFGKLGLNEKHADLFRTVNPETDPTAEAITAFAKEYGLGEAKVAGDEEVTSGDSFEPAAGGTATPDQKMSSDDWNAMYRENPVAAIAKLKSGAVKLQATL